MVSNIYLAFMIFGRLAFMYLSINRRTFIIAYAMKVKINMFYYETLNLVPRRCIWWMYLEYKEFISIFILFFFSFLIYVIMKMSNNFNCIKLSLHWTFTLKLNQSLSELGLLMNVFIVYYYYFICKVIMFLSIKSSSLQISNRFHWFIIWFWSSRIICLVFWLINENNNLQCA